MIKQLTPAVLGLGLALSPFAAADIVGAGASVGYWHSDLQGDAVLDGDQVDVDSNLDLGSDGNLQLSAALEHPLPLLPNLRLGFTRLEHSGTGTVNGSFGDLQAAGAVRSELDLDQVDLTFYYEILDNWVNIDAGLTARLLDAELSVVDRDNASNADQAEVEAVVPMVYLAGRFDLPATDFSVGLEGNGVSFDGDSLYDITAYGQYELMMFQLQAGYRRINFDVEDGDDTLDIEIDGPFLSAGFDF